MSLSLIMIIALPMAFAAYCWYRHVFERECLAVLREEDALAAREARVVHLSSVLAADSVVR